MVLDNNDKDDKTTCCGKSSCFGYGFVTLSLMLGICECITLILMFFRGGRPAVVFCWIQLLLYRITNNHKGSAMLRKVILGTYLI